MGVAAEPTQTMSSQGIRNTYIVIAAFLVALMGITFAVLNGAIAINAETLRDYAQKAFVIIFLVSFGLIFFLGKLTSTEKKGMGALFLVCVASTCFWLGFEQAGSSLSLFTRDFTDRSFMGLEIPIVWFQNANPFFIIIQHTA